MTRRHSVTGPERGSPRLAVALSPTGLLAAGLATVAAASASMTIAQPTRPSGNAAAGEALFSDRCVSCHVPEGGGQGPSLTGVFGRKAGSVAGVSYSAALQASGIVWTAPALDRFLADPQKAAPGTAMPIAVPDAEERSDIIAYLATQPKG